MATLLPFFLNFILFIFLNLRQEAPPLLITALFYASLTMGSGPACLNTPRVPFFLKVCTQMLAATREKREREREKEREAHLKNRHL